MQRAARHVAHSDVKSETDLKSNTAQAISISTAKPKPGQGEKIYSLLKMELHLHETCTLTTNLKNTTFSMSGIFVSKQTSRLWIRTVTSSCAVRLKITFK